MRWNIANNGINYENVIIFNELRSNISLICLKEGAVMRYYSAHDFNEHEVELAKIERLEKFTACYRDNACFMSAKAGDKTSQIPYETQFLLIKRTDRIFLMLIAIIDTMTRSCIMGDENDNLSLIIQTGSDSITAQEANCIYMLAGDNPYQMIKVAAEEITGFIGKGRLQRDKKKPSFMKYLGWCTYNAFYDNVSHKLIMQGLESFKEKGILPGFVLIDAGWQTTDGYYLSGFKADKAKFPNGLKTTVADAKAMGVKKLMAWHAYNGFWCGVKGVEFEKYNPSYQKFRVPNTVRKYSQLIETDVDSATVGENFYPMNIINEDIGTVTPDFYRFYFDYYEYLRNEGIDGTKIDAMAWVEAFGNCFDGRVDAMSKLITSVEGASAVNFDGELICCSGCSNDYLFQTLSANVTRTSGDFLPDKPKSHGVHIYTNAQVSFWFGEFTIPDWDMFQTHHESGEFHAMARAISGGPIYIADELYKSNENIIKKLCFENSEVPLCSDYARICEQSMFSDCGNDLKLTMIFNKNKYNYVIGAFNCCDREIDGYISPSDIWGIDGEAFAVYSHRTGNMIKMLRHEKLYVKLSAMQGDIFTVSQIINGFAPIGLINKYNSGGCIKLFKLNNNKVNLELMGSGTFLGYFENNNSQALTINEKEITIGGNYVKTEF